LPRRHPETEGVNPAGISAFLAAVDRDLGGLHGFMLLRHGRVLAEGAWTPYAPELPHQLFSLTKSFASTAVGLAVAEGRLTVDTPVLALFPAQAPTRPGDNLLALRVRHLLTMTTGHHTDPTGAMTAAADGDWVRAFLAQPIEHEPGTYFVYNSGASHLLAAIVTALTGQDLREYLRPRLFEPLGIAEPAWETCPRGVRIGGWGLSLRLEDIARFGQLYLQRGQWRGR
jgi:CubicO group peptidase (beta-lactamase class C family)